MQFTSGSEEGRYRALRTRAARLALASGVLICAGKFAAFGITGSSAVLSDAAESIVNVAAAALLLYSIALAALPADRNHPYGHGKVEFFSAGVEGTLIVIAGLLVLAFVRSTREPHGPPRGAGLRPGSGTRRIGAPRRPSTSTA
jgi:divalent metal cation (Fe/Co/Zn/Cd) transporter